MEEFVVLEVHIRNGQYNEADMNEVHRTGIVNGIKEGFPSMPNGRILVEVKTFESVSINASPINMVMTRPYTWHP